MDFIFNGSCFDNLFDPATAIKSLSKMLRPHGRIMHLEHGTPLADTFLCYSPEWFFDFYALNGYADCQIFICVLPEYSQLRDWHVHTWRPYNIVDGRLELSEPNVTLLHFMNIVVAEKGDTSTDDKTPVQNVYRNLQADPLIGPYVNQYRKFEKTSRRYADVRHVLKGFPAAHLPSLFNYANVRQFLKGFPALHLFKRMVRGLLARFGFGVVAKIGKLSYHIRWLKEESDSAARPCAKSRSRSG